MPSFGEPTPKLNYSLATEIKAIDKKFTDRNVPKSQNGKLLLASWNIANLGEQKRKAKDLKLIAHICSRFDLIAVQEIKSNISHFDTVVEEMEGDYDWIINDTGGNAERLGFIYRKDKVKPGRLFAEIAVPEKDFIRHDVVVSYTKSKKKMVEVYPGHEYIPFDRNPFVGTFKAGVLEFNLVNVHLYFGAFKNNAKIQERAKYVRRVLEILMMAKWAKKQSKNKNAYSKDIILVGDMNVPRMDKEEAAYRALMTSGLEPKDYFTKTGGSNLAGIKTYDQMAITGGKIKDRLDNYDVLDFDDALFAAKWKSLVNSLGEKKAKKKFDQYVKFYVSDHRPLWMQLDVR
jgi:endonuclease/exonuclease/phosphatase family metal-dependent hydrolase